MRTLLLGCNGQLGWELQRALAPLGEPVGADLGFRSGAWAEPSRLGDLQAALRRNPPDLIVNAVAYTAVDRAENEQALAWRLNADLPDLLAQHAAATGAWLVHYSTEHVFDGSGTAPWREEDPTGPVNAYGRSKLAGEQAVRASGSRHLILRSSWLHAARGRNFVRSMLALAMSRERFEVVDDQVGAPTGADLLADLTAHMLRQLQHRSDLAGTYHATASGHTSRHGWARFIVDHARAAGAALRVAADGVVAVPSSAWAAPARRPLNSRLDCGKLERDFGLRLPDWRDGVARMLQEVLS